MTRPVFLVWSEALLTVWQLAPFWHQMLQIQKRALAGGVGERGITKPRNIERMQPI